MKNKDYTIIPIKSFQQANKYAVYNNWCTSLRQDDYKAYSMGQTNQLYYCLRKDFENVKRIEGDDFPKDNYGLSMILVIIGPNGEFMSASTRWNDIQQTLTVEFIQELLGVDFYKTFLPSPTALLNNDDSEIQ